MWPVSLCVILSVFSGDPSLFLLHLPVLRGRFVPFIHPGHLVSFFTFLFFFNYFIFFKVCKQSLPLLNFVKFSEFCKVCNIL